LKAVTAQLLLAWLLAVPASYLAAGFLGNFYSTAGEVALLSLLFHWLAGISLYRLLGRAQQVIWARRADFTAALAVYIFLSIFGVALFDMAGRFPALFDRQYFLLPGNQLAAFAFGLLMALPCLAGMIRVLERESRGQTRLLRCLDRNLPGVLLAICFFLSYLILASVLNRPAFDVDDIFFDSDGLLWRLRFTTGNWQDYYWRSVHPFVLLLIRPLVTAISFFLKGDRLSAAFILIALAGAACVFLTWYFVKRLNSDSVFALLIAAILGGSAAHLVFSSLIETYIFLAALQALFFVLLLPRERPLDAGAGVESNGAQTGRLLAYVLTGLAATGITVTNFIQPALALIAVKRDLKLWIKYCLIVGLLTFPLTLLNNSIYRDAHPLFFDFTSLDAEADNTFPPTAQRAVAVARVMGFHSMIAPDPLILQEEIPFLKVWIFKADPLQASEYETTLGLVTALFWMVLLALGGIRFLSGMPQRSDPFSLAFILIVLFNFALHLRYGKDVFLYSTNWIYALVLFLALAWKGLSKKNWFRILLLMFLVLLLVNNARLVFTMLSTAALHIK